MLSAISPPFAVQSAQRGLVRDIQLSVVRCCTRTTPALRRASLWEHSMWRNGTKKMESHGDGYLGAMDVFKQMEYFVNLSLIPVFNQGRKRPLVRLGLSNIDISAEGLRLKQSKGGVLFSEDEFCECANLGMFFRASSQHHG